MNNDISRAAEILSESMYRAPKRERLGDLASIRFLQNRVVLLALSPGIRDLFFFAGRKMGEAFAKKLPKGGLKEAVEAYFKPVSEGKQAIPELVRLDEDGAVFRLRENASSYGIPDIGRKVCHFDEGVQTGMLSALTGKRFISTETKCYANGDEYCEFEVRLLLEEKFAEASEEANAEG